MHRLLKKEEICTVPNLLSLLRLLMIPGIVWLYTVKKQRVWAVVVIALSGVTDVLDGFIARHFHMVSDFGKILDPIADKLTQFAMILCLLEAFPAIGWLLALFVAKEMVMAISGCIVIQKKDSVNSSQWFGKVTTALLYGTMMLLFIFPDIPGFWVNGLFLLCGGMILLSMVKYLLFYRTLLARDPGGTR